jgi:hypothetical protein
MERNNEEEILNLLEQLGFDRVMGYEIEVCWHRALTTNEPIYGPRITGFESCSGEWLASGLASAEAILDSCTDKTLRDELVRMNKQGSCDKTWHNEQTAKSVIRQEKEAKERESKEN